jgi:hypothetical protein
VQGASPLYLPGLQEVRGQWSGNIQAYGGGTGTTSCDFDLKGQGWQWGTYGLDAVLAAGSFHSEEGLQLQEVGAEVLGPALHLECKQRRAGGGS